MARLIAESSSAACLGILPYRMREETRLARGNVKKRKSVTNLKWTKVQLRLKKKQKEHQKRARHTPGTGPSSVPNPERPIVGTVQSLLRVVSELLPPHFSVGMSLHVPKSL